MTPRRPPQPAPCGALRRTLAAGLALAALMVTALPLQAQPGATADAPLLDAREAFRKKDRNRLAALRTLADANQHPLAGWVAYWELTSRINEAQADEVEGFYTRWRGSYVEDRLRNDWLLELGKRRDWANFERDFPRFRMNDDREVTCYRLLTEHQAGRDVRDEALATWTAQRDLDDGCHLLAGTLAQAGVFKPDDLWRKARLAAEQGRPRTARAAAALAGSHAARDVDEALDNPMRYLRKRDPSMQRVHAELALLALLRVAANDPDAAAGVLDDGWSDQLTREHAAWAWAFIGRQAAGKLAPTAAAHYQRAWSLLRKPERADPGWSDDTLAWGVRSALRSAPAAERWGLVQRAIAAMSESQQRDPAWVYWKARALQAGAARGEAGETRRAEARQLLQSIAGPLHFYGKLAADDLGEVPLLPAPPLPASADEREAALAHPGLTRALKLIAIGLRSEGVREWNFSLRGMGERELLAAAQLACDRQVWDRCIHTSDRTRTEVDLAQRFPMPLRELVEAKARETGLDPAYIYGLIRQESRFVMDARSGAGASGLMQIMPGTARWTAHRIGLPYTPGAITDRETNLTLGASYLKLLVDDFGGSPLLAAAAYNAGPSRPRRWRDGPLLEPAVWAENVPFNETRDYVKKVLSNAAVYAALRNGGKPQLKAWLGAPVGPRAADAAPVDTQLP